MLGPRGGRAVALMLTQMKAANGGVHTGLESLRVGHNAIGDQVRIGITPIPIPY